MGRSKSAESYQALIQRQDDLQRFVPGLHMLPCDVFVNDGCLPWEPFATGESGTPARSGFVDPTNSAPLTAPFLVAYRGN